METIELHNIILEQLKQKQPLWSNWMIGERIGSGAYSMVYRITAERSGRTDVAAMKVEPIVPSESAVLDEERRQRSIETKRELVINESNIMHKLKQCPNIVSYEDESFFDLEIDGKNEGCYFCLRMEYLSCLGDLLRKKGGFDLSETNIRKLARDIANGIKAAHDMGIIHRDLKPSNFFLDEESGTYKLGDFNISKETEFTRTFAGTNGYLAPEVYKAKSDTAEYYTKSADIYSFGISLYVLMNDLYMPFEREFRISADEAIDLRVQGRSLEPPANCSAAFGNIILKACAYERRDRYHSIDELIRDLKRLEKVPVRPYQRGQAFGTAAEAETPRIDFLQPVPPQVQPQEQPPIQQKYAKGSGVGAFNPVPLIALILSLLVAGALGIAVYMLLSSDGEEYITPITSISANKDTIDIALKENVEITEVECPEVISIDSLEPMFGYKYSTELISSDSSLILYVNEGANEQLQWNAPEGINITAKQTDSAYYVTVDATDSYGRDQDGTVTFYSADKTAICKVDVHVRNTGPFKEDVELSSSAPEVISFNENNNFQLNSTGKATVYWTYGGEVKYSKDIEIIK
ncbi:MAG: serine/threonine-protein kinase [Ruminococcus sp.]|nr:serine/threonine-protein kinase [Ruminococcus sp.]